MLEHSEFWHYLNMFSILCSVVGLIWIVIDINRYKNVFKDKNINVVRDYSYVSIPLSIVSYETSRYSLKWSNIIVALIVFVNPYFSWITIPILIVISVIAIMITFIMKHDSSFLK